MSKPLNGTSITVNEARLQFRRCEMKGFDFEQYYSELKRLLAFCKFSESSREERLVEQIIHGVSDDSVRNKLTAEDEVTLEDVLKECRNFYAASVEELTTGSPSIQIESENQRSEQSSGIVNGSRSPDSQEENFQELPSSKVNPTKLAEAETTNTFKPITTAEELFSTTPSESNVIKLLDSESSEPASKPSTSIDDKKEETESTEDIVSVSSKTRSSKKAAKGEKSMTLKLKRIDNELLEKHEKTLQPSSKPSSIINGESEDTTSNEIQTFSLNTSGNATTSDDELNLALVKKKKEQNTRSEQVTTESSKSVRTTAETSSKSEANLVASESEESSSESSEPSEDEAVEEIETPDSNDDSDFEVSSKSNDNVRRSRRIKKDKKSKEKQKKKEEKNSKHGKGKWSRKRGIDNLNVSDEISDSDDNDKKTSAVSDDNKNGDDDDEGVVKAKSRSRKKKRKVVIDEDDSDNNGTTEDTADATSTEVGEKGKKTTKKEDEENDEQDENESPTKAGRKNIRQILSTKDLEKDTRKANIEERERRKRISEKSKDGMTDFYTREKDKRVVYTRLCFEQKKGKDLVYMNEELVGHLKPHQVEGVQFLWDCTVESASRAKETQGSGAILAHCMGLGKTLQVISFIHTMLSCEALPFKTALIIVPANTILNWVNEFEIWMPDEEELAVFEISQYKDDKVRADVLSRWSREGGVMIIGYNMFRMFVNPTRKKAKRHYDKVKAALLDPGPDFVVCDEGHLLKNDQTALSKAVAQIKSRRRIVLTGTPLQNNLVEYHCMVNFVKQNLLGTKNEFRNRFINPISNGQQKDARPLDVKIMKRRSHVLHELLAGCVQRRDYCYITKYLPPKYEYVLSIRMTERQVRLYNLYLKTFCFEQYGSSDDSSADSLIIPKEHQVVRRDGTRSLFKDFQMLARIWTHPYCLKLIPPKDSISDLSDEDSFVTDGSDDDKKRKNKRGEKGGVDNDDNKPSTSAGHGGGGGGGFSKRRRRDSSGGSENSSVKDEQEGSDDEGSDLSSKEVIKKYKTTTGRGSGRRVREMSPPVEEQFWYSDILQEEDQFNISLSGKLVLLCEVLKSASEWKDKVLVFSQSLMTLTLIEDTLAMITEAKKNNWKIGEKDSEGFTRAVDGTESGEGTWVPNKDYLRLDGGSSVPLRKKMCDQFNSKSNRRCRLFLISTKAGSLGINLVSANRVIIFDASWNPSHDIQSMFRCYRFGQKKPVYVYRFIGQGTMEEKIYNRQVTKESLSLRVVDENQIDRHFSKDELDDLYQFEPNLYCENDTTVPLCDVPQDDLLADLMIRRKDILFKYHQHDSLLQHQADQNLSEEDKRAAWEEYERERQGGPNAAQVRQQQMRDQMMANNMTALQQQYLRQQQQSINLQQQVHDAKYLEKACHDMINWGASIGVPGANKQRAALSIQSFNDAIRRMTPSITFKQMGDKVYDLFPNYYLNSLGIQNPRFAPTEDPNQAQLQQLQQTTQPIQQNNSTTNHVNQGFGVNDVQLNASNNRQETVNLSSSDTAMNERNMSNARPVQESATSNSGASQLTKTPSVTETQSASESHTSSSS